VLNAFCLDRICQRSLALVDAYLIPFVNYGTGSGVDGATAFVQDEIRFAVSARPRRIPCLRTASTEYSEQVGRYRQRMYFFKSGLA
jgi:hypothetical protein